MASGNRSTAYLLNTIHATVKSVSNLYLPNLLQASNHVLNSSYSHTNLHPGICYHSSTHCVDIIGTCLYGFRTCSRTNKWPPTICKNLCGDKFPIWATVIIFGVSGITILAVAIIATLTRKVHLECFKDCKEVNSFVFLTVLCLLIWLPYTLTFSLSIPIAEASFCFGVFPYMAIPFFCKIFLFVPKIWSSRHKRRRNRTMIERRSTLSTSSLIRRSSNSFSFRS